MADNNGDVPVAFETRSYVGLSNQGATCYMNSLLQTLWMTPEFRKEVYKWTYDCTRHGSPADCIPLQLQVLFARLQLASSPCVDTKALTQSFQWKLQDSFEQHDVQEFCRVLFDALERSVSETPQSQFIQDLYQGTYKDYVKCQYCHTESAREDQFLDLSLTVRSLFEQVYNESVTQALKNYVKPEELAGDNQYFCNTCGCKRDALKGLKFAKLPYVMMLQLKRFDIDFMTMKRIKLNDKVKFPHILNMNPYISQEVNYSEEGDNGIAADMPRSNEELVEMYLAEGEHVYELYSVLVHSGSALGGHYYAYIKNVETGRWSQFNDASVKHVSKKVVNSSFGLSPESTSLSSATAYLLFYRKIDPSRNVNSVDHSEVPDYVVEMLEAEEAARAKAEQERIEKKNSINVHVYHGSEVKVVSINKQATVEQLTRKAAECFDIASSLHTRLRMYSVQLDTMQEILPPSSQLEYCGVMNNRTICIETKLEDEEWSIYNPNIVTVFLHIWDDAIPEIETKPEPLKLQVDHTLTLEEFRYQLEALLNVPASQVDVLKKGYMSTIPQSIISRGYLTQSLTTLRVIDGSQLYIEPIGEYSKWEAYLSAEANKYLVRFNDIDSKSGPNGYPEYSNSISINAHKSLYELKVALGKHQQVSPDEFIMRRGSPHASEIKDLSATLPQASFTKNTCLHIERGTPSKPGEFRLKFFIAKEPDQNEIDGVLYAFELLCELSVDSNTTVVQLKDTLSTKLVVESALLRVREKFHESLGKVLQSTDKLSQYQLSDRKTFSVQILDAPDQDMTHDWAVASIKCWNPQTWELTPTLEMYINKEWTAREFGEAAASQCDISVAQLGIFKVEYAYNFMRSELDPAKFLRVEQESFKITKKPWFVGNDTSLFIAVDLEAPVRPLTGEERRKYRIPSLNTLAGWTPPQETSVKITVRRGETPEV